MTVTRTLLTSGDDTAANGLSIATASITPAANKPLLLTLFWNQAAAVTAAPTVTGNGLTWTLIGSTDVVTGTAPRMCAMYRAIGAAPTAGPVTITSGDGGSITGSFWSVVQFDGALTTGTNAADAFKNLVQSRPNASTTANLAFPATLTPGNATYSVVGIGAQELPTAGAGWTQDAAYSHAAPTTGAVFQFASSGQQNITASWTSSVISTIIGIEVVAAPVATAVAVAGTAIVAEAASATSITCNVPAGVTVGELLVVALTGTSGSVPDQAGWTTIASGTSAPPTGMFYRVATGSEPASYTFTGLNSGGANRLTAEMVRLAVGVDTTTPLDVPGQRNAGSGGAALTVTGLTTVTAGALVLYTAGVNAASATDITPDPNTTLVINTTGTGRRTILAKESRPTAGATGSRTFTETGTTGVAIAVIAAAFRPSATSRPKLATLVDTFSSALNTSLWTATGSAVTTTGGRLNLVADGDFESVESVAAYDFTASSVIAQVVPPSGSSQTFITLSSQPTKGTSDNEITWLYFSGALSAIVRNAGVETNESIGTYDPAVHGTWVRIRHVSGTTVAFDTSLDGVTWTQRGATKTVTWDMTNVVLRLTAGGFSGATAFYDNINTPPAGSAPTVNAGADATVTAGTAFTRTATETTDSTIASRAWTIVSGPAGAGTTIGTTAALTWTPSTAGTYVLRYSATNATGTGTDDVTVTVTATAPVGGTFTFAITGTPDGDSVPIKVKTAGAASVRLKVATNAGMTTGVSFTAAQIPDGSQYTSHVISGLAAGTAYWYAAEVDGVLSTTIGQFTTDTPATQRSFRVAFSSCLTSGNTATTAFDNITANAPELFIHLGDFHYDNNTTTGQAAHQASIENQIGVNTGLARVIRTIPLAYQWSDHDSGNNDWTGGPAAWTPSYNAAYREVIPVEGTLPTGGIYRSFGRGRVKFILTDGRSFKTLASATDDASKTMFGAAQEAWIASELADPAYPVKVICLDVPWVYPTTAGDDKWGGYKAAAQRLVDAISSAGANVFLIHGDAHSLCADNGTSASNTGGLPVAGAAPLGNTASLKGGPYSQGTWPTFNTGVMSYFHGLLDVTDTGSSITIRYSGRDETNTEKVTLSKTWTVSAPTTLNKLKVGAASPSAIYVGSQPVSKVYLGATPIWP